MKRELFSNNSFVLSYQGVKIKDEITKVLMREKGFANILHTLVHCSLQVVYKYVFAMTGSPSVLSRCSLDLGS